jgi:putative sugar O-methyltransferase
MMASHKLIEARDLLFRLRNKIRHLLLSKTTFNETQGKSDSQVTFYEQQLGRLLKNKKRIGNFRRKYDYREILEHVTYTQGKSYLEQIQKHSPQDYLELIKGNKENDLFGNPYKYQYPGVGRVSPTTLRYISTAIDIFEISGLNEESVIAEIGVGYGGQAAILERMYGIKNYSAFDLPSVIQLSNVYLNSVNSKFKFTNSEFSADKNTSWDVVISNYAFSEFHRDLQLSYIKHVIAKSKSGYMIMNSGRSNITGRSEGKLSLDEIRSYIPNLQVKEEVPLTGPDNYIIYWN